MGDTILEASIYVYINFIGLSTISLVSNINLKPYVLLLSTHSSNFLLLQTCYLQLQPFHLSDQSPSILTNVACIAAAASSSSAGTHGETYTVTFTTPLLVLKPDI